MLTDERIKELLIPFFVKQYLASVHWPDIFEEVRVIESEVLQAMEPAHLSDIYEGLLSKRIASANIVKIPKQEAQEPVAWLHNERKQADVITSAVKKLLVDSKSRYGFDSLIQRFPVSKAENYTIPLYATPQPPAEPEEWIEGYPSNPWDKEWFIALTTYGDKVVLKALPETYSHAFKTADETYIKKESIKAWRQFPDSEFISPHPPKSGKGMK